jgi:FtsH-binding integral membrane protein
MRMTAFMIGFIALIVTLTIFMFSGPRLTADIAFVGILLSLGLLAIDGWIKHTSLKQL